METYSRSQTSAFSFYHQCRDFESLSPRYPSLFVIPWKFLGIIRKVSEVNLRGDPFRMTNAKNNNQLVSTPTTTVDFGSLSPRYLSLFVIPWEFLGIIRKVSEVNLR